MSTIEIQLAIVSFVKKTELEQSIYKHIKKLVV